MRYNVLMIRLTLSSKGSVLVVVLAVVTLSVVVGGGAYIVASRQTHNNPEEPTSDSYRGYKRGTCAEGTYEAWSGGAPTGDHDKDTVCLDKEDIDKREASFENGGALKPVIMLYADKDTEFSVTPQFAIQDSFIYPAYNTVHGWSGTVLGGKEGDLIVNHHDYDYLFWEGKTGVSYNFDTGTVVPKEQTTAFLEHALSSYGLTAREAGDFITFWAPRLMQNDYNLIRFANEDYAATHPLDVTPTPDYVQRVFMIYKPTSKDTQVAKQEFPTVPKRHGFSLIEWGGEQVP